MRIILFILASFFCVEFNSCGIFPNYTISRNDSLAVRAILDSNGLYKESVYSIVYVLRGRARYLYIGPFGGGPSQASLAWKLGFHDSVLPRITKVPKQIGDLDLLDSIRINKTSITALPDEIANLPYLHTLDIQNNKINKLPDSLKNLSALKVLDADSNDLDSLATLPHSLIALDVSRNNLTAFSNSIYLCTSLYSLIATYNAINYVSDSIKNLKSLKYLFLNGNDLTTLPLSLLELTQIKEIGIDYNHLVNFTTEIDSFISYRQYLEGEYISAWKSTQTP